MSYTLSELAPIPKPITTKSHPTVARTKKGIANCHAQAAVHHDLELCQKV